MLSIVAMMVSMIEYKVWHLYQGYLTYIMCANTPIHMMMDESLVIKIVMCRVTIHTILKMFEIVIFQSMQWQPELHLNLHYPSFDDLFTSDATQQSIVYLSCER